MAAEAHIKTTESQGYGTDQALCEVLAQRPRVVIMCGISGSGKTVFARRLEEAGYRRLSVDECARRRHGNALTGMPAEELKAAYGAAVSDVLSALGEALKRGGDVVVDGTMCKRALRVSVYDMCRDGGVVPLTVYMSAPAELLAARLAGRGGRGADDQCVSPEMLARYLAGFETPSADEHFITVVQ